jgi:predicted RNA-binding protein with RPS1 domain
MSRFTGWKDIEMTSDPNRSEQEAQATPDQNQTPGPEPQADPASASVEPVGDTLPATAPSAARDAREGSTVGETTDAAPVAEISEPPVAPADDPSAAAAEGPPTPAASSTEPAGPPAQETPQTQEPVSPGGLTGLRIQIGSLRDRVMAGLANSAAATASGGPGAPVESETQGESTETVQGVVQPPPVDAPKKVPRPSRRDHMSGELELEVEAALGDMSLSELIEQSASGAASTSGEGDIEPQSQVDARIVSIGRDEVFFDLGGRNQGVAPINQFETPPEVGVVLKLTVNRYDSDDGLYEVSLPGAAVEVADWTQVSEGMIVEAMVTGHNKGGLECRVGALRGFMPISQVSLYRVDEASEFVGQKLACVVTETNPRRRNLVLSHRAVLERQQAEARELLWNELQVGQLREGVVRSLKEFGAFVDLGGVDGMIHISQLSWDRIGHPNEVLEVGQQVRVKIEKIDREARRVGLVYRDLMENPWTHAADKFPVSVRVTGTVTKIMDFGALVRLEPGIAGLVHISELSHTRIWRVSDVVEEGQEVEVQVLSVDPEAQRISLSLKALQAAPQPAKGKKHEDELPLAAQGNRPMQRREQLKGGISRGAGGERFGLKW